MPHVIVKMYPGRTEEQKRCLAARITAAVTEAIGVEESSVSIAIEEVPAEEWAERVYRPDIMENKDRLYKEPGYDPFMKP